MGRFFIIISAIFHGALLLLLFSWEVPLADRIVAKNILEVSLVEKVEETNLPKILPRILKEPEKVKIPEKREMIRAPEKEEVRKEEKREEKIGQAQAILKEQRQKADDPAPTENKALKDQGEQPLGAQAKTNPQPQEGGNLEGLESWPEGKGGPGAKEGSGSAFLTSAASLVGGEGIDLGGGGGIPGRTKGEGSPGQMANIHHSPGGESDAIPSLILRKLEAAKRYPRMARKMGIEGTAVVRFKLKPEGRVEAVEIVDSSGSEILDTASLETVRAAAPFPYKEGWLKVGIVFKIF
jgi:TonB family protein